MNLKGKIAHKCLFLFANGPSLFVVQNTTPISLLKILSYINYNYFTKRLVSSRRLVYKLTCIKNFVKTITIFLIKRQDHFGNIEAIAGFCSNR